MERKSTFARHTDSPIVDIATILIIRETCAGSQSARRESMERHHRPSLTATEDCQAAWAIPSLAGGSSFSEARRTLFVVTLA